MRFYLKALLRIVVPQVIKLALAARLKQLYSLSDICGYPRLSPDISMLTEGLFFAQDRNILVFRKINKCIIFFKFMYDLFFVQLSVI